MLAKVPVAVYNCFQQGPAFGELGKHFLINVFYFYFAHSFPCAACRLYGFFGGLTGVASITTLTAISIDRYHVVVYPLDPLRSTTRWRARIMVVIVWLYSLFFSIIPALDIGYSKYVPEGYLTTCSFDYLDKSTDARIFMFVFFLFAWAVPFTIITYCYVYILKVVASTKKIQSNKDKNKTELKLTAIVLAIIGLWFLAWTPYSIVALLGISGNEDKLTPIGSMIPAVFCKSAACIDPYVYAITHPRFRMELKRMFLKRSNFSRNQTSYSRGTSTVRSYRIGRSSSIDSTSTTVRLTSSRNFRRSTQQQQQQHQDGDKKMSKKTSQLVITRDISIIDETSEL